MALVPITFEPLRRLAGHDFFPDFSRRVRPILTGPLGVLSMAFVLAIVCGFVLHPRLFALAGGLGLVLAFGVCWPWVTTRGVRGQLGFERERAVEGEAVGYASRYRTNYPGPPGVSPCAWRAGRRLGLPA